MPTWSDIRYEIKPHRPPTFERETLHLMRRDISSDGGAFGTAKELCRWNIIQTETPDGEREDNPFSVRL